MKIAVANDLDIDTVDWTPASSETLYRELTPRKLEDIPSLLDELVTELNVHNFSHRDCLDVRLAMQEAIVNGLRHGNSSDPRKRVTVRYYITPKMIVAEIEDEGRGFDPASIPDPTAPENLEKPSGRGLFLMRHCMSWLRHDGRGNQVT